jgi:hypothetical protein
MRTHFDICVIFITLTAIAFTRRSPDERPMPPPSTSIVQESVEECEVVHTGKKKFPRPVSVLPAGLGRGRAAIRPRPVNPLGVLRNIRESAAIELPPFTILFAYRSSPYVPIGLAAPQVGPRTNEVGLRRGLALCRWLALRRVLALRRFVLNHSRTDWSLQ